MILVTGATGRVGYRLMEALADAGAAATAMVRVEAKGADLPGSAKHIVATFDYPPPAGVLQSFDRVFLLSPANEEQAELEILFIGYLALRRVPADPHTRARRCAVLALLACLDVPIVHFSVQWWNSLHQGATITAQSFKMAPSMLAAMLILLAACWIYAIAVVLVRVRCIIREREREAPWLAAVEA